MLESLRSRFELSILIHLSVKFFRKVVNQRRTAKNSSRGCSREKKLEKCMESSNPDWTLASTATSPKFGPFSST